ncbi:ATP synthase subunit I [Tissierella pigra]|uniref:ATP synthase subunit I n=1 Tax=Tissierella pigra TaxID=2607614 RepID=A0A6N7XEI4_9FIRM|nr:ATP synthase subunit I [Tissierella pigra]MBU5427840.1 ATP synthase subunit I [Tissierella pigra]MSU00166.1 ATP synthase subunit I [Tissierella pigra]
MNNDLVLKIIKRAIVLSLISTGVILFIFKDWKPIALGLIFGTIISILTFKLLHNAVNKSVTMPPRMANAYSVGQYTGRFLIYGAVLVVAALANYLNFLSTFIGLIMIRIVISGSLILDREFLKR